MQKHRLPIGRTLVSISCDESVSVGINDDVVIPRLRVAKTALVELANGQNCVLHLAVDVVAAHVEVVRETVVLLDLLELTERRGDQIRVDDADVCRSVSIFAQRSGASSGLGIVLDGLDV